MANLNIPAEERNLVPAEVAQLDRRRRRGQLLLVMGFQFALVTIFLTLWSGQDLTYSPGWVHPMFYWNCIVGIASATCLISGIKMRRGLPEFFSY
ncbi:MAG: hypothetical protein PW792_02635 [Acidobacteriaceae bacterium]|nr:hypothetical protein [Acidobacteriaceae bacterium]